MNTKELGDLGERIACEYLVKKGFKIIEKNFRIKWGEIDIIAKKKWRLFAKNDKTIHFVEVKTILQNDFKNGRPSKFEVVGFFPEEKVNYKKQKKLKQLCQIWLEKNMHSIFPSIVRKIITSSYFPLSLGNKFPQNYPYQIDVIGILVDLNTKKSKIHYFANVVEDR